MSSGHFWHGKFIALSLRFPGDQAENPHHKSAGAPHLINEGGTNNPYNPGYFYAG